jgi:hypothetical protein
MPSQGGALEQEDLGVTYKVAKSIINNYLSSKWEKEHPAHQKGDAYHQLPRQVQVTTLRLHTGHNRLWYHMYHKFKIGKTNLCTCGTSPMTAEHLLQDCPTYSNERMEIWEQPVTLQEQLYGNALNLELTTDFFKLISVSF